MSNTAELDLMDIKAPRKIRANLLRVFTVSNRFLA